MHLREVFPTSKSPLPAELELFRRIYVAVVSMQLKPYKLFNTPIEDYANRYSPVSRAHSVILQLPTRAQIEKIFPCAELPCQRRNNYNLV